jgi:ADP-heptose:LPS heptosyltransferase
MRETVVILRTGSLGDTVVALPAFRHIRRLEPNSRIVLLTNVPTDGGIKAASSYQVLAGSGLVDAYAEYRPPRRAADVVWLVRYFRRERPRRLYYLMPQRSFMQRLRDRIFFFIAGVREIRGLAVSDMYDKARLRNHGGLWESESVRLLRMIGGALGGVGREDFDLGLHRGELERAKQALGPIGANRYLVVSLGTKLPVKDWGDDNWRLALTALSEELPHTGLVMIGSADEFSRCEDLAAHWCGPAINLCGKLTPRESGAVASGAVAFVGHDSGPAHLAAAAGAKVVTVFSGRSLPGVWFPFGNEQYVLWERTDCFNCGLSVCEKEAMRCIRSITPQQVVGTTLSAIVSKDATPRRRCAV